MNRMLKATLLVIVAISLLGAHIPAQAVVYGAKNLKGSYSFLVSSDNPSTPFVWIGVLTFDGVSKVSETGTVENAGTLSSSKESGTYSVNPDGTGTMTLGRGDQFTWAAPSFEVSGTATHQ
jgi:hypothetical protein